MIEFVNQGYPVPPSAYIILGINEEGRKEVISITVGEAESAKFRLYETMSRSLGLY